ncbi:hypothetical protein [Morganella morganii IS15]|nr:hypothetical protein CSB69_2874 [Morganella morganii]EMP53079.1 hypothetical protein C790_03055 [Morganella morganii SC01]CDK68263.1 hypothetical protein [Morganella morganii IS15]
MNIIFRNNGGIVMAKLIKSTKTTFDRITTAVMTISVPRFF